SAGTRPPGWDSERPNGADTRGERPRLAHGARAMARGRIVTKNETGSQRMVGNIQRWRGIRILGVLSIVALLAVLAAVVAGYTHKGHSVKADAKKASAALAAGLQAQTQGQLDVAAARYREVLKYDSKNKYAIYDLALIDASQQNFGLAEDKYRQVLAIDGAYEPALFNLAIMEKAKGHEDAAIALYERATAAAPKDPAATMTLGILLRSTGKVAAGDAEVKEAIRLNRKLVDPAAAAGTKSSVASPAATP